MKQCSCFGSESDVVKWGVPESHFGDRAKFLHICTKCGHTHAAWMDAGRPDAEDQASSSSDDNTAL